MRDRGGGCIKYPAHNVVDMSTLSDVAATAGVSPSTVSRVLNGKGTGFISEATAERVRQAADELGYRPSAAARSLVTGYGMSRSGQSAV